MGLAKLLRLSSSLALITSDSVTRGVGYYSSFSFCLSPTFSVPIPNENLYCLALMVSTGYAERALMAY